MFKKSRRKIVAAIMAILVLILLAALGVIYASSYFEMTQRNKAMLEQYADHYVLADHLAAAAEEEESEEAAAETESFPADTAGMSSAVSAPFLLTAAAESEAAPPVSAEFRGAVPSDEREDDDDDDDDDNDDDDDGDEPEDREDRDGAAPYGGERGGDPAVRPAPDGQTAPAEGSDGVSEPGAAAETPPAENELPENDARVYRLSTFYSVALAADDVVLAVDNDESGDGLYSDDDLEELAEDVLEKGKTGGVIDNLRYLVREKEGYTLVAFIDNTIMNDNTETLMRSTLIFGSVFVLLFFIPATVIARRIVKPLEENYQKQKQFISDAGHELKTPVAVVSANAELLERDIGANPWLDNIRHENARMGSLVGQLLDLARTEQVAAKKERVDFSRVVTGEALPFESVAYEKGLTLRADVAENVTVRGDSGQLQQVTSILLDNAMRHAEGPRVDLSLKAERNSAVLRVTNDGEAIPEETRKAIFERFYRGDSSRRDSGHYGLGLAIAKAIAEGHGGSVSVDCGGGKVTFRFEIPLLK